MGVLSAADGAADGEKDGETETEEDSDVGVAITALERTPVCERASASV